MNLAKRDLLAQHIYDVWTTAPEADLFTKCQRAATVAAVVQDVETREARRLSLLVERKHAHRATVLSKALAAAVLRMEQNGLGDQVDEVLGLVAPLDLPAPDLDIRCIECQGPVARRSREEVLR